MSDNDETSSIDEYDLPSLSQLLGRWQDWSDGETFERAARQAEAAGDVTRAAQLRAVVVDRLTPAVEALAAQHQVTSLLSGWEWQTVRAAREEGATWAQIGRATETEPEAVRSAYLQAVDRQERAAAQYGWSFGMTANEACISRDMAGDWTAELRSEIPDAVREEIEAATARGDTEALATLQGIWWDPQHAPVPPVSGVRAARLAGALLWQAKQVDNLQERADLSEQATRLARAAAGTNLDDEPVQHEPNVDFRQHLDSDGPGVAGRPVRDVVRLECPECGEDAVEQQPETLVPYSTHEIEVPRYAHSDGEPLCPVIGSSGYEPAQPREVFDESGRRTELSRWHEDDQEAENVADGGMER